MLYTQNDKERGSVPAASAEGAGMYSGLAGLPLTREVARRSRDGGREKPQYRWSQGKGGGYGLSLSQLALTAPSSEGAQDEGR